MLQIHPRLPQEPEAPRAHMASENLLSLGDYASQEGSNPTKLEGSVLFGVCVLGMLVFLPWERADGP